MLQNSFRLALVSLFRSFGICGWCFASLLLFAQFADSRAYGLDELPPEDLVVADCTNAATCINGEYGSETCGKYGCNAGQTNCSCQPDKKAEQCVCRTTVP